MIKPSVTLVLWLALALFVVLNNLVGDTWMGGGYLHGTAALPPVPVRAESQPSFPCCKYTTAYDLARLFTDVHLAADGRGPLIERFGRASGARNGVAGRRRSNRPGISQAHGPWRTGDSGEQGLANAGAPSRRGPHRRGKRHDRSSQRRR